MQVRGGTRIGMGRCRRMEIIVAIILGGFAGWIAEKVMASRMGLLGNIALGLVGAFVGAWVFGLLGVAAYGTLGWLVVAVAGACLLIFIGRLVRGRA